MAAQVSVATLSDDLQRLADLIDQAARSRQGESIALLALLRLLEQCHREICETLFRDALPDNRQNLYALLRDIDLHGGWPYIQRMKLRSLFANCPDLLSDEDTPSASP
ncbi:MAG TPA: hypothetical protein IGR64_04080 [Leptolyngbyaceae cyanobacterium M65_K2018_010]|nr:hypothetical protein [Leptolyngbyaceae cyanobacterium M65_K2018_010]